MAVVADAEIGRREQIRGRGRLVPELAHMQAATVAEHVTVSDHQAPSP